MKEHSEIEALQTLLAEERRKNGCLQLAAAILNEELEGTVQEPLAALYDEPFCSDWFVMLLLGPVERTTKTASYHQIPEGLIRRGFRPAVAAFGNCAFFPLQEITACLINPRAELMKEPAEFLEQLRTDIEDVIGALLPVKPAIRGSIGVPEKGRPNAQKLYRTAKVAWDHGAEIDNQRPVILWQDIDWESHARMAEESAGAGLSALERQFMNFVNDGKYYDAITALDRIMDLRIWQTRAPLGHIATSMFARLETVLSLSGVSVNPDEVSTDINNAMEKMMQARSFTALRASMYEVFALLDDIKGQKAAKQKKAARVQGYIEKHYADENLNLTSICAYFRFSEAYLSRVFREELGVSVLDCIHSIRIEKAKDLLETTDKSVSDIAEAVGFSTTRTMNRLFNKQEGMPPRTWREMVRSHGAHNVRT